MGIGRWAHTIHVHTIYLCICLSFAYTFSSNIHWESWYNTGWWFQPLWKIWKSIGMIIPNIWENKKCSKPPTRIYNWWQLNTSAPFWSRGEHRFLLTSIGNETHSHLQQSNNMLNHIVHNHKSDMCINPYYTILCNTIQYHIIRTSTVVITTQYYIIIHILIHVYTYIHMSIQYMACTIWLYVCYKMV